MTHEPVVSVVTPVFNGAKYLDECIRSVRAQTFQDWELLVVDNASTDGSPEIALRHARQDPRVRVYREPEFVSIYRNHNRALERMAPSARYCKIVHADDWLYPECLARMVQVAEAHASVGIVAAFRLVGSAVDGGGLFPPGQEVMKGRDVLAAFFDNVVVTGSPTTVLYRVEVLRRAGGFFDEDVWHADTDAANRVLLDWDCGFVHQVLSYTRWHVEAQTTRSFRINTWISNEGRELIRYGHAIPRAAYRCRVRAFLVQYAWFLVKQLVRPWRYRDVDYQRFHRQELEGMIRDAAEDRATRAALRVLRILLMGPVTEARAPALPCPLQADGGSAFLSSAAAAPRPGDETGVGAGAGRP